MIFEESRIVKQVFNYTEIPSLKKNTAIPITIPFDVSIYRFSQGAIQESSNVSIDDNFTLASQSSIKNVTLNIYITSIDEHENSISASGYFLDEVDWYLVNLFFYKDCSLEHSIVLSPMTPPSSMKQTLVEYREKQISNIPSFASNLAFQNP